MCSKEKMVEVKPKVWRSEWQLEHGIKVSESKPQDLDAFKKAVSLIITKSCGDKSESKPRGRNPKEEKIGTPSIISSLPPRGDKPKETNK